MPAWNQDQDESLWLLQLDLSKHSLWAIKKKDPFRETADDRACLAEAIDKAVHPLDRVFWAGDGGLYAASIHIVTIEQLIPAADNAFEAFEKWRTQKNDREILELRISIHRDQLFAHKNPSYWYSPDFNTFLKNERRIGIPGTIVITRAVYNALQSSDAKRWQPLEVRPESRLNEYWDLFIDTNRKASEDSETFHAWLLSSEYNIPDKFSKKLLPSEPKAWPACGEAILLVGTLYIDGFQDKISLEPLDRVSWVDGIHVETESKEKYDFPKASPVLITEPQSDRPELRISYHQVKYTYARNFQLKVYKDPEFWGKFSRYALSRNMEQNAIPRILCAHILVIIIDEKNVPYIVLCRRSPIPRQLDFEPGAWSVSIEEQYRPVTIVHKNEEADQNLHGNVIRGVREELLGKTKKYGIDVEIHGLIVESRYLNLSHISLARVHSSVETFREQAKKATDRIEIDSIVLFPLEPESIDGLLGADKLSPEILDQGTLIKKLEDWDDSMVWHTTSKIRLALARWLIDRDYSRDK